jgi:hypothetical protein
MNLTDLATTAKERKVVKATPLPTHHIITYESGGRTHTLREFLPQLPLTDLNRTPITGEILPRDPWDSYGELHV